MRVGIDVNRSGKGEIRHRKARGEIPSTDIHRKGDRILLRTEEAPPVLCGAVCGEGSRDEGNRDGFIIGHPMEGHRDSERRKGQDPM